MNDDLANVLYQVFLSFMSSIYTAMPGTIQSYNKDTKTATVQPGIKMTFADGTIKSMPIISEVQVIFPGTKKAGIQFELVKGDGCLLVFSSESLENWYNSGGSEVEAGDQRRFSLTDAFCIPGLFPSGSPGKVGTGKGLEIMNEDSTITLTNDGKIELNGNDKQLVTWAELNQALQSLMTSLSSHTHMVASLGAPTSTAATSVPPTNFSINLSSCKTTTLLTGG